MPYPTQMLNHFADLLIQTKAAEPADLRRLADSLSNALPVAGSSAQDGTAVYAVPFTEAFIAYLKRAADAREGIQRPVARDHAPFMDAIGICAMEAIKADNPEVLLAAADELELRQSYIRSEFTAPNEVVSYPLINAYITYLRQISRLQTEVQKLKGQLKDAD